MPSEHEDLFAGSSTTTHPVPSWHRTDERAVVGEHGHWLVLAHPVNSTLHRRIARVGHLHMQLWHRHSGISVLTPSPLTDDKLEVWLPTGHLMRPCSLGCMKKLPELQTSLPLPCTRYLARLEALLICGATLGAVGGRA